MISPAGRLFIAEDVHRFWSVGKVSKGACVIGPLPSHASNKPVLTDNKGVDIDRL